MGLTFLCEVPTLDEFLSAKTWAQKMLPTLEKQATMGDVVDRLLIDVSPS